MNNIVLEISIKKLVFVACMGQSVSSNNHCNTEVQKRDFLFLNSDCLIASPFLK